MAFERREVTLIVKNLEKKWHSRFIKCFQADVLLELGAQGMTTHDRKVCVLHRQRALEECLARMRRDNCFLFYIKHKLLHFTWCLQAPTLRTGLRCSMRGCTQYEDTVSLACSAYIKLACLVNVLFLATNQVVTGSWNKKATSTKHELFVVAAIWMIAIRYICRALTCGRPGRHTSEANQTPH